ncbi:MAG: hypothetical protein WC600_17260 [Desulfobaccales bacterium]
MTAQEYNSILLSLLGVVAGVGAVIFWRMITRMEKKIDDWFNQHLECRERQNREFVKVKEFETWQKGREPLWRRLNRHSHHPESGQVIITEE